MTILFFGLHLSIDPAVLLSVLTLVSGCLGASHHRRTRRK